MARNARAIPIWLKFSETSAKTSANVRINRSAKKYSDSRLPTVRKSLKRPTSVGIGCRGPPWIHIAELFPKNYSTMNCSASVVMAM